MSDKLKPKSEQVVAALIGHEIEDARRFHDEDRRFELSQALDYYNGEMPDLQAPSGRSNYVAPVVRDVIGWLMPQMMRMFTSTDAIAEAVPTTPEQEDYADQVAALANHIFIKMNNGYERIQDCALDGLLSSNGIWKVWYDPTETEEITHHTGLDFMALAALEEEGEILELEVEDEDETFGPLASTFGAKVRRVEPGKVMIDVVPPEDFFVSRNTIELEETDFCAQRIYRRASDLIEEGYDKDIVMNLPTTYQGSTDQVTLTRRERTHLQTDTDDDPTRRMVQLYECYALVDEDGDGIAEPRFYVYAGGQEKYILKSEEIDACPFIDWSPYPISHRWRGDCPANECIQPQRVKSVLVRETIDNLRETNTPTQVVSDRLGSEDQNALINRDAGATVIAPGSVGDVIGHYAPPFFAKESFAMIEWVDLDVGGRTGVSKQTAGLDPEQLQNQSATAVVAQQSAAQGKIEYVARNFANGLRKVFKRIIKLSIENIDEPMMVKVSGQFVEVDPRPWNAEIDVSVNVGLGTGTRERDVAALQMLRQNIGTYIQMLGPDNPFAGIDKLVEVDQKLAEATGLKNPDLYIADPPQEQAAMFMQQQKAAAQQGQNAQLQAEMAMKQHEAQMKAAQAQQDAQAKAQIEQFKAEKQVETDLFKARLQADVDREIAANKLAFEERKAALEHQYKMAELEAEERLEARKMLAGSRDGQGNIDVSD